MSCYQSNWDDLRSELCFLKSTYCQAGECEITSPPSLTFGCLETHSSCYPVAVQLQLSAGNGEIGILLKISNDYPQLPPSVTLSSSTFPPSALAALEEEARTSALSHCPEASLFQLVDQILQSSVNMDPYPDPPTTVAASTHNSAHSSPTDSTPRPHAAHTIPGHYQHSTSLETDRVGHLHQAKTPSPSEGLGHLQPAKTPALSEGLGEVWLLALDHMRNKQRYIQALERWSRELLVGGWVVVAREHTIVVVLVGRREGIREMVKRWKKEAVDVDRRGRPCRERMMRVLCQHRLPPQPIHKYVSAFRVCWCVCNCQPLTCSTPGILWHVNRWQLVGVMVCCPPFT